MSLFSLLKLLSTRVILFVASDATNAETYSLHAAESILRNQPVLS